MQHQCFFRFQEIKTQEELLLDLKILCWDVFFPESILNVSEKKALTKQVQQLLIEKIKREHINELEFSEILLLVQKSGQWKKRTIDKYNLMRLFYDPRLVARDDIFAGFYWSEATSWRMCAEFEDIKLELNHVVGSNNWYVLQSDCRANS